jgi:hypothetical protein
MPTFFSDQWTTGLDQTSLPTLPSETEPHAGIKHARERVTIGRMTVTNAAAGDIFRFLTLRSSDRLLALYFSTLGIMTGADDASLGIYLSGDNHDGAVEDVDLFDVVLDLLAVSNHADMFTNAALTHMQRGQPLWELNGDSVDPHVNYDVAITTIAEPVGAADVLAIEAHYLAGD